MLVPGGQGFLFAKPLSPERYYGQAFVVHCAGFMMVMLLLGAMDAELAGALDQLAATREPEALLNAAKFAAVRSGTAGSPARLAGQEPFRRAGRAGTR